MRRIFVAAGAALLFAGAAFAQSAPRPQGYLAADALAPASFLPAPPAPGSAAEAADKAAYKAALALKDTPRWAQATADDDDSTAAVYRNYRCALGVELKEGDAPALDHVLARTWTDAVKFSEAAKPAFNRPRPFVGDDPTAPICVPMAPERRAKPSTSYPSGHATLGFVRGLILGQLAPDKTSPVMARTQSFIESRQVCRLHAPSDLEAGKVLGAAVYARLQAQAEFQADMRQAAAELAALRAARPAATGCAAG